MQIEYDEAGTILLNLRAQLLQMLNQWTPKDDPIDKAEVQFVKNILNFIDGKTPNLFAGAHYELKQPRQA